MPILLANTLAVIQPAIPPPTIIIFSLFIFLHNIKKPALAGFVIKNRLLLPVGLLNDFKRKVINVDVNFSAIVADKVQVKAALIFNC